MKFILGFSIFLFTINQTLAAYNVMGTYGAMTNHPITGNHRFTCAPPTNVICYTHDGSSTAPTNGDKITLKTVDGDKSATLYVPETTSDGGGLGSSTVIYEATLD